MSITVSRLRVTFLVTSNNFLWLKNFSPFSFSETNIGSAIEAKLQTATSSFAVYSMISVHKFEERMVPKFF